jgi:3-oxoacyl-[acyl-carrier protein] reductase
MDLGLAGRVAIVTGASRGIGKACAAELAAEGAHVLLLSKDRGRNDAACAELVPLAKGRVVGAPADLNNEAARGVRSRHGRVQSARYSGQLRRGDRPR